MRDVGASHPVRDENATAIQATAVFWTMAWQRSMDGSLLATLSAAPRFLHYRIMHEGRSTGVAPRHALQSGSDGPT